MEHSPCWEAKSHSDCQETPHLLRNQKIPDRIHKGLPNLRPCVTFRNKLTDLRWRIVSPSPKYQGGGPPLDGCPRLLIQHFASTLHP